MLAFDPAELRNASVDIRPLPDEHGRLIDASSLPSNFAEQLRRKGLDISRTIQVVGIIARSTDGRLGRYSIHFRQA